MAAYISVPRDLTRVKSKILFGLTKRQIVCFGTGALIGVPVYFFVRGSGNLSLAALSMIAVMLPFFFLWDVRAQRPAARGGGPAVLSGPVSSGRKSGLTAPTTTMPPSCGRQTPRRR